MPMVPISPKPGIDYQATPLMVDGGWSRCNLIRFQGGKLQKRGGYFHLTETPVVGVARAIRPYQDLTSLEYFSIGTNKRLYNYSLGSLTDITPIGHTSTLTTPLATTFGSAVVTITDGTISPLPGDLVTFKNTASIGGLLLYGPYTVVAVGSGTYTINAGSNATATVATGGKAIKLATTAGQTKVVISTDDSHVFVDGQTITIGIPTLVGGITLSGAYTVTVAAGVASITSLATASGTATATENSGSITITYLINVGYEGISPGSFGAGPFGIGPFGTGSITTSAIDLNLWSLDTWGQQLLALPRNGVLYKWDPSADVGLPASAVAGAPAAHFMFVMSPQEQVILLGADADAYGEIDPLYIRWSDVGDYTIYVAASGNQAGGVRLFSAGSKLVGGMQVGAQQALIWTDLEVWSMQYIGYPLIYGFNKLASGCGLISSRSAAQIGTFVAWMAKNQFFSYHSGTVLPLPCSVFDFVFNSLDRYFSDAVFAVSNTYFNEIVWYFPKNGDFGLCKNYVSYNVAENLWDYGELAFSCGASNSNIGASIAVDYNGIVQQFESSIDFDGQSMDFMAQTGYFRIAEGRDMAFLDRLLPDLVLSDGGSITITVLITDNPLSPPASYGPFTVTGATEFISVRARGRLVALRFESSAPNTFVRVGETLALVSPAGRR